MKLSFTPLQWLTHLVAWFPLAWLLRDAYTGNLTVNPIQAATQRTGDTALVLLLLSLACTPVSLIFGFHQVLKVRRALGIYAFLYAAMHFLIFIGLDYRFNWKFLSADLTNKPYIWAGLSAGLILLILAVTSSRWWMRRLGKNWKRLHRLIYLAGVLVVLHYAWVKKGSLFTLSGDIGLPLAAGVTMMVLLVLRIPLIRRKLARH